MKAYTDLEQSKKLAEILPVESADMSYIQELLYKGGKGDYKPYVGNPIPAYGQDKIPCWSLAALLSVIPEGVMRDCYAPNLQKEDGKYTMAYGDEELLCEADNPIDACVEMIIKLHEINKL